MTTAYDLKQEIRSAIRKQRQHLSNAYRVKASRRICKKLIRLPMIRNAASLLVYLALPEEVSLDIFIHHQLNIKKLYAPRMVLDSIRILRLHGLHKVSENQWHIREPILQNDTFSAVDYITPSIDLALIPGIAFDPNGNRIGFGKGYFDRFLKTADVPTKIGIAFECQMIDELPHEATDIPMDYIITEKRIYRP